MANQQLNTTSASNTTGSVLLSGCQHVNELDRMARFEKRMGAEKAAKLDKHGADAAPILDAAHAAARQALAAGKSPAWVTVEAADAARQAGGGLPMELAHRGQLHDFLVSTNGRAGQDEDMMSLVIMVPEAAQWAVGPKEQPLPEMLAKEAEVDARLRAVLARIQVIKK